MLKTRVLLSALFIVLIAMKSEEVRAEWKPVTQGTFTYWESGSDQAFPLSTPAGSFYYKTKGAQENQWTFHTPVYQDPETKQIRYRSLFTDGTRIFEIQTGQTAWMEWQDCNLPAMKDYFNQQYQQMQSQAQTNFRAYYIAKYFESEKMLKACEQMKLRIVNANPGR